MTDSTTANTNPLDNPNPDDPNAKILDSNTLPTHYDDGRPVPVTIPIPLAPGVKVVYTTRLGGVSTGDYAALNLGGRGGDDPAAIESNREALAGEIHARLSLVGQVHSAVAVDVDDLYRENAPYGFDASGTQLGEERESQRIEADGQATSRTGIALGMFAADCLPVLFADPATGIIGAAHCGRRGLQRGVIGETVDLMVKKGAKRDEIVATLGPRICGECYEVGDEVAEDFQKRFPLTKTTSRFGGAGIDIAEAAMIDLAFAGVHHTVDSMPRVNAATKYLADDEELKALCRSDNEGDPELHERLGNVRHSLCTLENPLWFSHRRAALAGKTHEGRLLALVVRE
ncbi:laccase domain-containing protein [Bifidobacterium sp. SMB2]|uniref:Laccase domain-containing protein n=1 Tax=Bifidobacterium saimiriisciurei TaxID=2661627 RepID=A0ABX0C8W2_9BIFI|nr:MULTISPECIES: polyphenol oxidase family protein [Bifidobacterium]NEG96343.1 laccase domain-containing protein [Bifidobacterium sp. SMB2]NEH11025.1 laccase domain-containing protein [Bifidobacterium saimiriisciurei]